jgi:hypothetical protein
VRDADAIAVVNKGKIVEQGSHDEVGWPGLAAAIVWLVDVLSVFRSWKRWMQPGS